MEETGCELRRNRTREEIEETKIMKNYLIILNLNKMNQATLLNDAQHIKERLSMYAGDIGINKINRLNLDKFTIEKIETNLSNKKILDEIIENSIDYILNENVKKELIVTVNKLNSINDIIDKSLEPEEPENNIEINKYYAISFSNEIKMKMHGDIIIGKNETIRDCIPKYLITNPKCSTKYQQMNTIGMNGYGMKIIPYLCDGYKVEVKIDNELYEFHQIKENSTDSLREIEQSEGTLENYWKVTFIVKSSSDILSILQLKLYEAKVFLTLNNENLKIIFNNQQSYENVLPLFLDKFIPNIGQNGSVMKNVKYQYILKKKVENLTTRIYISVNQGISNVITIVNGKFIYNYLPPKFKESLKEMIGIDNNDIFKHISILLILEKHKFEFRSQSKDILSGNYILEKTSTFSKLKSLLEPLLTKTVKNITIKGDHYVPGSVDKNGTLIIVEGLSALTAVRGAMNSFKQDQSQYSYYAVTGKLKNFTRNENSIDKKNIVEELHKILNYSKNNNKFKEILIFADADEDGTHIVCLVINLFQTKFPNLINLLKLPVLPSLICCGEYFIDKEELNKHQLESQTSASSSTKKHSVVFCKGLGSYTKIQLSHIIQNKTKYFFSPEFDEKSLKLFCGIMSRESKTRKELYIEDSHKIETNNDNCRGINDLLNISMNTYVKNKYKEFLMESNKRCLPSLEDSFNPSTRKLMYTLLKDYYKNNSIQKIKINELASRIISKLKYHHGDVGLTKTILKNSSSYPTGLTIPLLLIEGNGGSRYKHGKDHANARYISGYLHSIINKIIRKEDDIILEYQVEDLVTVEPKLYYPIIPLILINVSEYIGTGFNCNIPTFNPLKLIKMIKNYLNNKELLDDVKLEPYVRGFTGTLTLQYNSKFKDKIFLKSEGSYEIIKTKRKGEIVDDILITEIPHFHSTVSFLENLNKNNIEYKLAKDDTLDNPKIIIENITPEIIEKINKSIKTIKGLNLNLFYDERLKLYKNYIEIFNDFYQTRYVKYELRKEMILKKMKYELIIKSIRYNLNKLIVNSVEFPDTREKQDVIINNVNEKLLIHISDIMTSEELLKNINDIFNILKVVNVNKINIEKQRQDIIDFFNNINEYSKLTVKDIWIKELDEIIEKSVDLKL